MHFIVRRASLDNLGLPVYLTAKSLRTKLHVIFAQVDAIYNVSKVVLVYYY